MLIEKMCFNQVIYMMSDFIFTDISPSCLSNALLELTSIQYTIFCCYTPLWSYMNQALDLTELDI